ncbi:DUF2512 family protein [Thalassobacillus pellis]|uniref:DUF2512 family protein n=1 Tax=Thalassobacillus pellis TaxID=748008 RepID=UPI00195F99CB|nr:DUF2512 family protein [Thalassobacillus pellis]MBM7554845.1 hypothetical protein [Thalassobacillus pellis]
MAHLKALAIKGVMTLVLLWLVLSLGFNFSFLNVLTITIVLGTVAYLSGDLYVYPKKGNMVATTADFGLTFLAVWLIGMAFGITTGTAAIAGVVAGVVLGMGEYIFHFYIKRKNLAANEQLRSAYTN